ncbi:PREDICTED: tripartite motif-containing protein 7-like, partial [Gekko japonicus]|uniref:Tripartite motif-containing protein 7-like n=1 Tax=Gekko japonicus TaxID=146911 RepID=A0ABM1KZI0_GEKJA
LHRWDPVILDECGHNFCRACLTLCWEESGAGGASCPMCKRPARQRNLKPNRQLANVVEIAKKLSHQGGREGEAKGRVCEKHQEPLKLFCKDDEAPLCVVCDRSKDHRDHRVIPVEEAAQEYQDKFCCCLGLLRKERKELLAHQVDLVGKSQDLLGQTEVERQKMVAEFRKMHTFLEEQEELLLAQVEEVKEEIAREKDKQLAWLSKEISSLGSLIREVEEKIEQPVAEFLQGARSSLQRYEEKEKFRNPATFTSKLKWRIWELCDRSHSLELAQALPVLMLALAWRLCKVGAGDSREACEELHIGLLRLLSLLLCLCPATTRAPYLLEAMRVLCTALLNP